ncbi:MAG: HAMP domain-containing histidine kinase, partial [Phormidesmis sp. CAN_BIN44]|nr:HAMP domain-containing histidine kinase [Phormidesmis sp. CAN_BIN44]
FNHKLECQVRERTAQIQEQMQQLQQLDQLKDDFLNTVSHELRSPMATMTMAIQMLQLATSQENHDRYLQILQAECARETALIDDLLDLQRLEAGVDTIELQALHLQEWLPLIVEAFQERAQSHQQTLQLDIAPNLPPLISNPLGLERVVTELLTNACKYTPPGGSIIVTVCATSSTPEIAPNRVVLTVCNSGVEIPAAVLTRVFEKFYRIPNSDRWQRGGTGLGLALVQKLVEQLGGEIRVESQMMQTVFTVELPNGRAGEGTP